MTHSATTASPLNAEDVAAYLTSHPEFFVERAELLAELTLPHESGGAISLVERQVALLRERNVDMRNRLNKLLENARENDKLFDKTKRLILNFLEAQDMGDLVDALYYSFDKEFGIHFTSLLLFGHPDQIPSSQARIINAREARDTLALLLKNNRAFCGQLDQALVDYIFAQHGDEIGSVAIVPLAFGAQFGLLAIANRDPNFYRSSMGTLFLSYVGESLSRLLSPYLERPPLERSHSER